MRQSENRRSWELQHSRAWLARRARRSATGDAVARHRRRACTRAPRTLAAAMVDRYRAEIADYRLADEAFVREEVQAVTLGQRASRRAARSPATSRPARRRSR